VQHTIVLHVTTRKNRAKGSISSYLLDPLPPLREAPLPDERNEPVDILPDERMVLPPDERTAEEDERVVLLDERTAEEDERDGVALEERVTLVELLRTGVAVVVRVVVVVLRVALLRVGVVAEVRVVVLVIRLGVVAVPLVRERVATDDVLTVLLPKVRSPVVLTRVAVPRVAVPVLRTAVRDSVRRAVSNARALLILRDALRDANERSGWR
jgi:hypothetical protein